MEQVDVAVIGAGVVGLAIAEKLSHTGMTVLILEKNDRFGIETSSRNSEVIHSGIYYPAESLKTRLCIRGNEELYALCSAKKIPFLPTGKIVIARSEAEEKPLHELYEQGKNNGVKGLKLLTKEHIKDMEPLVNAYCGLFVPSTGVIDSEMLMRYFFLNAQDQGVLSLFKSTVDGIEKVNAHRFRVHISPQNELFEANWVINAAGLYADTIASYAGIDVEKEEYRLIFSKGEYVKFKRDNEFVFSRLIYPLPESSVKSLGIHMCFDLKKHIRFGPNRYPVDKIDYAMDESHKKEFTASIHAYLPFVREDDLYMDTCGIRPQRKTRNNSFADFIIQEESKKGFPGLINLIGIESPGLTCAPAIAEYVSNLIK
ncbi:MAG: NAD(P)/FAD-dependent oxidoreductase [bacterium]